MRRKASLRSHRIQSNRILQSQPHHTTVTALETQTATARSELLIPTTPSQAIVIPAMILNLTVPLPTWDLQKLQARC